MSNQRAGKMHRAGASDSLKDMQLKIFFRTCKEMLEQTDNEDAAFYFEQVEEHITNGGSIFTDDRQSISRILGC